MSRLFSSLWPSRQHQQPSCSSKRCKRAQCEAANDVYRRSNPSLDKRGLLTRAIMCNTSIPCATELLFSASFFDSSLPSLCQQYRHDSQWPTWDPHLRRSQVRGTLGFWEVMAQLPNRTVWLHGDSVMLQFCDAALCSLIRHHFASLPVRTPSSSRRLRSLWRATGLQFVSTSLPNGATLLCSGLGTYEQAMIKAVLPHVDVAMLNVGLHYHSEKELTRVLRLAFSQLAEWAAASPRRIALWRETSAQHFRGGAYSSGAHQLPRPGAPCRCEPLVARGADGRAVQLRSSDSQDDIFERKVANLNLRGLQLEEEEAQATGVGLVPFFNLTAPRHDMHRGTFCSYSNQKVVGRTLMRAIQSKRRAHATTKKYVST
ncbi:MAG: hypothetical protein SGPRY_003620 [Prymnesium sp.]